MNKILFIFSSNCSFSEIRRKINFVKKVSDYGLATETVLASSLKLVKVDSLEEYLLVFGDTLLEEIVGEHSKFRKIKGLSVQDVIEEINLLNTPS